MSEVKKSILKEALSDYNIIMEAATAKAKNDLANEFPDKFNDLLKEQLENNKKPIKQSSKLNESNINSEPVMEKTKKETTKKVVKEGFNQPFDKVAPKVKNENFNITELDMNQIGGALENTGGDEEITMNEIEQALDSMTKQSQQGLAEELKGIDHTESPSVIDASIQDGTAYGKLVGVKKQLDEIMESMGGAFDATKISQPSKAPVTPIQEEDIQNEPISDEEISEVLSLGQNTEENAVEEQYGVSHSANRGVQANNPGNDYVSPGQLSRRRDAMQEQQTKINGLVKENASLTKKLNEIKKTKDTVGGLLEDYKTAVGKYRTQLKEMAIFNTNLAFANNLLVNEELALTQDDKVKIISEFKNAGSIEASKNVYSKILTEMKDSRKTITESIEDKVTVSLQPSSKQKLDEVVEKTAYKNDAHIMKMKKLISYVENRGKNNL